MEKPATTLIDLGRDYQLNLFYELITDHKFAESVIDKLETKHFNVEVYQKLIQILKHYHKKHEVILNFPNLITQVSLDVPVDQVALKQQLLDTIEEIKSKTDGNKNVQEFTSKFCKMQSLKGVLQSISKKVERGVVDDYDDIEKELKDALIFKEIEDSITVYNDITGVLADDYRNPIPTGIEGIDEILQGGLSKGEVGLVIAPLGVGKSTILTKFANTAYSSGRNVLQVFFEDKEKSIQRKHFTLMSNICLSDLSKKEYEPIVIAKINEFQEKVKINGVNELFLQKLPANGVTIPKIKNIIKKLNSKGHKIDMVVLDYIDCLILENGGFSGEEWANEGKIMREFEVMCEDMDIAGWTATQGNRCVALDSQVVTKRLGKTEIKNVIVNDEILTHKGYKKIINVFPIEKQPLYRIKLKSGKFIDCSAEHKFPTNHGVFKSISSGLCAGSSLYTKR